MMKEIIVFFFRLNEAQQLQQSVKQEKTQLEMKYQDEIQLAKVG
jgi:hypothetical protein